MLMMTERRENVRAGVSCMFGHISIALALLLGWAMLWVWQIHACDGMNEFVRAFSWQGNFFPPPGFGLIKLFYEHTYEMIMGVGVTSLGLGLLANKYSR